ncbi:SU10 major capsid protein [Bacillus wiedmannii]|uniref:SU10 major capsid protein n=1 Tax=Bacillus wiedmannii TaxID=1890302 RepID=UPI000BEFD2B1|nr:DUF5309 family protein [Bacillus wiedmannii]PEO19843.1 hypothetical protein CN546_07855 [Bacillus wiedmannii]
MANVTGQGTSFNLPNYDGELFTADAENTPFLSMIGGLTGGGLQTSNKEFATDSLYEYPAPSQPAISEQASGTAPTAVSYTRGQNKNVTQIFHESVNVTYRKLSNSGRLSGINTAGASNNVPSEKDFQIARSLTKIARDVEHTFLNGAYALAANETQADRTRGMFELCSTGNTIAAAGAKLNKDLFNQLLRMMATNGADFNEMVLYVNAFNKQVVSEIYGYAPQDRNVGGVNIQQIETDFAKVGIVWDRFVPASSIGLFDMSVVAPVLQNVPDKGVLFYEELAKTGAAEKGQIYGEIGLAHGPAFMHGSITGLAIS